MEVKQKNRLEDIKVVIDLGERYSSGTPFTLEFVTGNGPSYSCGLDQNGNYNNCSLLSNRYALCFLDDHGLSSGYLFVFISTSYKDSSMPTGIFNLSTKSRVYYTDKKSEESLPVYISDGPSDVTDLLSLNASYNGLGTYIDQSIIGAYENPSSSSSSITWQDFKDIVSITGDDILGAKFEFKYTTQYPGTQYVASYNGESELSNCRFGINEDNTVDKSVIVVPIPVTSLFGQNTPNGPIYVSRTFWISDNDFPSGYKTKVITTTLIPSSSSTIINSSVLTNALRGTSGKSAYELAVEKGFVGTEDEWIKSLSSNISQSTINSIKQEAANSAKAAAAAEIGTLTAQIDNVAGNENSNAAQTPEIDSLKEVKEFMVGYNAGDTLKSAIDDSIKLSTEEDIENMFN